MPTLLQRFDRFGVALTVLITVGTAMLQSLGCFRLIDDWVVSRWQQFGASTAPANVLLIELAVDQPSQQSVMSLAAIVERIEDLGATTIAIAPPIDARQFLPEQIKSNSSLVLPDASDRSSFENAPGSQLIHQRFGWPVDASTFEKRVAEHAIGQPSTQDTARLEVEGRGFQWPGVGAKIRYTKCLPRVDASRVIDGDLVPELVAGRAVIIGPAESSPGNSFQIPTLADRRVDELELRGQVIRCLLAGDWICPAGNALTTLAILVTVLLTVQVFRMIGSGWWPISFAGLLAGCVVAMSIALSWYAIEIPVTAMFFSAATAKSAVTRQRFRVLRSALDRRFNEANANRLRVGSGNWTRDEPDDVWQQAADAWCDLFAPTRIALLELDANDTYLTVRAMAGADESDIGERRRDVTRMPYRDAVDQKVATKLKDKLFFTATVPDDAISAGFESDRTQFAIPLIAGKTIGVVAIEIESSRLGGWDAFNEHALDFAGALAIHLSNHQRRPNASTIRKFSWSRAAELPEQWMATSIIESASAAKAADEMWMRAFELSTNPIAVCNPFGQVVHTNSAMISALQQSGQSLNEFDALDWLQNVTGRPKRECSDLLRRIVLQRRAERLFCKARPGETLAPVLVIRPLARDGEEQGGLRARAMSLELLSPSLFSDATRWEQSFAEHQREQIVQRVRKCFDASVDKRDHGLPSAGRSDALNHDRPQWDSILDDLSELVDLCNDHQDSLAASPSRSAPLALDELLKTAIEECHAIAESRGVGVIDECADSLPKCHLNPYFFTDTLRTLADCVSTDAAVGETLTLSITADDTHVGIQLAPSTHPPQFPDIDPGETSCEEILARGLGSLPAEVADEVHRAQANLLAWGGSLEIACSDDFRVSVRIRIRMANPLTDDTSRAESECGSGANDG